MVCDDETLASLFISSDPDLILFHYLVIAEPITPFFFTITTSSAPFSGTFDPIYISLNGTNGTFGPLPLASRFEIGSTVEIQIPPTTDIGDLVSFSLTSNSDDGWQVSTIQVETQLRPIVTSRSTCGSSITIAHPS